MAKATPIKGIDIHAQAGKNAVIIARQRLEDLYSWSEYVENPYHVRELHNLRIAAKRLRYTFEIFEMMLPPACQAFVEELTCVQDELGSLHDSDAMIALLRLCLGNQDSTLVYSGAAQAQQQRKHTSLIPPELVADLTDPAFVPDDDQRYGIEQLLRRQEQEREAQYTVFRQHWYQLQARDFRREVLRTLETE